jgi:hypothetical protein
MSEQEVSALYASVVREVSERTRFVGPPASWEHRPSVGPDGSQYIHINASQLSEMWTAAYNFWVEAYRAPLMSTLVLVEKLQAGPGRSRPAANPLTVCFLSLSAPASPPPFPSQDSHLN